MVPTYYEVSTLACVSNIVWDRLWAYTLEWIISNMAPQGPRALQGPYSEQSLRAILVGLLGFDRI